MRDAARAGGSCPASYTLRIGCLHQARQQRGVRLAAGGRREIRRACFRPPSAKRPRPLLPAHSVGQREQPAMRARLVPESRAARGRGNPRCGRALVRDRKAARTRRPAWKLVRVRDGCASCRYSCARRSTMNGLGYIRPSPREKRAGLRPPVAITQIMPTAAARHQRRPPRALAGRGRSRCRRRWPRPARFPRPAAVPSWCRIP